MSSDRPGNEKRTPVRRAVADLEVAAATEPGNANILSDLAAALLVLAGREDAPDQLMGALATVDRALVLSPSLAEARFNRALILSALFMTGEARAAWQEYLLLDAPRSPWAVEARERLAALSDPAPTVAGDEADRRAAMSDGRPEVFAGIVSRHPQAMREYAQDLLADWAVAYVDGNLDRASRSLAAARGIGAALVARTGERLAADSVAAIDEAVGGGDRERLNHLLSGHRSFHDGYTLYRQSRAHVAWMRLAAARRELAAGRSPFAAEATFWESCAEHFMSHYDRSFDRLVQLASALNDRPYPSLRGHVAWMQGVSRQVRGDAPTALGFFVEAALRFSALGEAENAAALESLIADCLEVLGRVTEAWRHRYQALAAQSGQRDPRRRLQIFQGMADFTLRQGEPAIAVGFQNEAVGSARETGNPALLADALMWRGFMLYRLAQTRRAAADLAAARQVVAATRDPSVRRRLVAAIATIEGQMEAATQPRAAIPLLTSALAFFEGSGHYFYALAGHRGRAVAYRALGQPRRAEADLRAGIRDYERLGAGLQADDQRLAFIEQTWALFDEMIGFQVGELHAPWQAFRYADFARTRVLPGLAAQLPAWQVAKGAPMESSPVVLATASIQRRLPPATVLVQYSLLGDRLLVWLLERSHRAFLVKQVRQEVIAQWIDGAQVGGRGREPTAALYDLLILPWRDRLGRGKSLVFIPDKILQAVPFAALWDSASGRYLIEDHKIIVAPSATLYLYAKMRLESRKSAKEVRALVVGDPAFDREEFPQLERLTAAGKEAAAIARSLPGATLLTGTHADRARFLALAPSATLIHFAGHAIVDRTSPLRSRLLFASGGAGGGPSALYAREIYGLSLSQTRLAVLAACETAGHPEAASEGIVSLARAFLAAGTPAVIASLWKVEDAATAELFRAFYQRIGDGADPAEALREAQIIMLRRAAPGHAAASWGAFELLGASSN